MTQLKTNTDNALRIEAARVVYTLQDMQDLLMENRFKKVEDKYHADILNTSNPVLGQVISSQASSGIKGFYAEITMRIIPSTKKELFAVSTGFVKSH